MLGGCVRRGEPAAAEPVDRNAESAVDYVATQERAMHSLRAQFSASVWLDDGTLSRVSGVLLVVKPDRFRMRLMLPLGITVFDYVRDGADGWFSLPLASERDRTLPSQSMIDLSEVFLREPIDPLTCEIERSYDRLTDVRCGNHLFVIRAAQHHTLLERAYLDSVNVRYSEPADVDGFMLPFKIEVDQSIGTVLVKISKYDVNPRLEDSLFQPPEGATHILLK
ncbi:MAG: hypothetical protein SF182_29065 [Deltaproteobacteria bacterium]|nr:hypothetical protein [Deltaproteobacteria bacterium]